MNFADADTSSARRGPLLPDLSSSTRSLNIFGDRVLALLNNISVGWHLLGVAIIIGLLVFVPDDHQSASFVFGERINNTGLHDGSTSNLGFWFFVLPIGFLLTMYTQTGYDASAHTAEETRGAAIAAAQGVWRSVFFSALIGWFVLLAFLFAANDVDGDQRRRRASSARSSPRALDSVGREAGAASSRPSARSSAAPPA